MNCSNRSEQFVRLSSWLYFLQQVHDGRTYSTDVTNTNGKVERTPPPGSLCFLTSSTIQQCLHQPSQTSPRLHCCLSEDPQATDLFLYNRKIQLVEEILIHVNTVPALLPASTMPGGEVLVHKPRNVHGSHARLDEIILAREVRHSSSSERSRPDPYHLIGRIDVAGNVSEKRLQGTSKTLQKS